MDCVLLCAQCFTLCAFFFFFKQKTAYEMRISDWSSDVCSSDLAAVEPCEAQCTANGVEQGCRPAHAAVIAEPDPQGLQIHHRQPLDQIGRASCRERVCQYV